VSPTAIARSNAARCSACPGWRRTPPAAPTPCTHPSPPTTPRSCASRARPDEACEHARGRSVLAIMLVAGAVVWAAAALRPASYPPAAGRALGRRTVARASPSVRLGIGGDGRPQAEGELAMRRTRRATRPASTASASSASAAASVSCRPFRTSCGSIVDGPAQGREIARSKPCAIGRSRPVGTDRGWARHRRRPRGWVTTGRGRSAAASSLGVVRAATGAGRASAIPAVRSWRAQHRDQTHGDPRRGNGAWHDEGLGEFEVWFLTGSQDLYGEETLRQVAEHAKRIAAGLDGSASIAARVVFRPVVKSPEGIAATCLGAGPGRRRHPDGHGRPVPDPGQ
jgi:hypothetical protein